MPQTQTRTLGTLNEYARTSSVAPLKHLPHWADERSQFSNVFCEFNCLTAVQNSTCSGSTDTLPRRTDPLLQSGLGPSVLVEYDHGLGINRKPLFADPTLTDLFDEQFRIQNCTGGNYEF